jgi:hypothetical protein
MRMNKRDLDNVQKRYLMLELSCADRKCNPCTYPSCQRFTRENGHKRIVSSRIFEAPTRISAGGDTYQAALRALGTLLLRTEVQSLHLPQLSEA